VFVDASDHIASRTAQHARGQREVERRSWSQREAHLGLLLDGRSDLNGEQNRQSPSTGTCDAPLDGYGDHRA